MLTLITQEIKKLLSEFVFPAQPTPAPQQDLEANETVSVTQDLSSESSGAYNSYTCTACSAGTFSITTNSTRCDSCVSGKFSASGGACRMELLVEKFELDVVEFFKTKFTGE